MATEPIWWEKTVEYKFVLDAANELLHLTEELLGFPRHLSQHTGGFVLTKGPLSRMAPIENASMVDRTVLQWDS